MKSMAQAVDLPKESQELFEDDFFGKLLVEYRDKEYRALFDEEEENIDSFYNFYPYKIIEEGDNWVTVEWFDALMDQDEKRTMYFVGNCYYVALNKFNEYFCRVE